MTVEPQPYSGPSRFVHWAMAFLILLIMIPVGLIMVNLPDGEPKNTLYELHKSFGMTIFALAVIRVAIRAVEGFPPLPSSLPPWQAIAARSTHLALYVLIFLVPALGFVGASMCCSPVNYFWLIPIPLEFSGGMERGETVLTWHKAAVLLMGAILCLHVAAALWHGFVRRDGVLERMLYGRR
ncbi:MAG: cytochrome b [Microvirga sp.]|nr:cytochrome b [Microvirga sp.]